VKTGTSAAPERHLSSPDHREVRSSAICRTGAPRGRLKYYYFYNLSFTRLGVDEDAFVIDHTNPRRALNPRDLSSTRRLC
jgi:hypothetical protein